MDGVRIHRHGPPDVLVYEQDVACPEVCEGQVLVRVHRAAVAGWDVDLRAGRSGTTAELPVVPGTDMAGTVAAVGPGVASLRVGDEVYGTVAGSHAQFALAPEHTVVRRPPSLSLTEAAALPTAACLAWQAIRAVGGVQAGQTVLVHGAAGSIGSIAVQLARRAGARVVATASRADVPWLLALGANRVVDHRVTPFEEAVEDVDVVLDLVGGDIRRRSLKILRPGGLLIVCKVTVTEQDEAAAAAAGVRLAAVDGAVTAERLGLLDELFVKGELAKPRIGSVLPLSEVQRAHELIETGRQPPGRAVLTVG